MPRHGCVGRGPICLPIPRWLPSHLRRNTRRRITYDAFLSYNHQDGAVAAGIQKGLHHIGRRVGQLNALRVFRDSTDLTANPDLWGKVADAMDRSRYLIVVLSPRAAASDWVNKEVAHWLERRGPGAAVDRGGRWSPALG